MKSRSARTDWPAAGLTAGLVTRSLPGSDAHAMDRGDALGPMPIAQEPDPMNRSRRFVALVVLATVIAACSQSEGTRGDAPSASQTAVPSLVQTGPEPTTVPSASPSPSSIETASPTESATHPTTDPATVLAADGIGPYVIGARMSDLQSQALITNIEPSFNCDDLWQHAEATGRYAHELVVTFYLGRLIDIGTDSTDLVTPSGARVGMLLADIQSIYGRRGTLITGTSGNQAFSVHVPDTILGIVFYLDATNTETQSMSAGEVQRLDQTAIVGEGC